MLFRSTVRDAERTGQQLLEQARQKAEGEVRDAMANAEKNAAARAKKILAENAKACDQLCSAAESHLDAAAALIVKRIVNV